MGARRGDRVTTEGDLGGEGVLGLGRARDSWLPSPLGLGRARDGWLPSPPLALDPFLVCFDMIRSLKRSLLE